MESSKTEYYFRDLKDNRYSNKNAEFVEKSIFVDKN